LPGGGIDEGFVVGENAARLHGFEQPWKSCRGEAGTATAAGACSASTLGLAVGAAFSVCAGAGCGRTAISPKNHPSTLLRIA
jgi:hypothetical protein